MATLQPKYDRTEFAQRGEQLFARHVTSKLSESDRGKFVAIDIDSGDFVVDTDDYAATERLLARHPQAQIWLARVGDRAAYRMGAHGHGGSRA